MIAFLEARSGSVCATKRHKGNVLKISLELVRIRRLISIEIDQYSGKKNIQKPSNWNVDLLFFHFIFY